MNCLKTHKIHADYQKSVLQECIRELSWDFQGILKGEGQLTKRQYVRSTTNAITTATATTTTSPTTTSIATTTNT